MVEKKYTLGWLIRNIVLWLVVVIMIFPLLHMVSVSLSDNVNVLRNTITFWPKGFSLAAYKFILTKPLIYNAYKNTIIYTVTGTLAALFILTTGAYALSKKRCPFGKPINILIMITMFFNGGMIPTYLAVKWLGLLDTLWAIILPGAFTAWNAIIMRSFFLSIPDSLEEAARIDGAGHFRILWQIYLPLSKAAIATVALMYGIARWNAYFWPMLLLSQSTDLQPLQVVLKRILLEVTTSLSVGGEQITNYSTKMMTYAIIMVSIIPMLLVYPFIQKYFAKGIMIGSVKG